MGELADQMINGEDCQQCGMPLDEDELGHGHPVTCQACLHEAREEANARRQQAMTDFDAARDLAESKGLTLKKFTAQHYQLSNGKWIQNIHPGNRRLYWDRKYRKPPFLDLPPDWTLLDVVRASQP